MDRYDADWRIVERGWRAHVHGDAPRFGSATAAIEAARAATPGIIDQDLPAFVVADGAGPVGPILDGDAVVMTNFRGDRAIEITRAFEDDALTAFDRGRRPNALYVGMMQYDGDAHLPHQFLVAPPTIADTMGMLRKEPTEKAASGSGSTTVPSAYDAQTRTPAGLAITNVSWLATAASGPGLPSMPAPASGNARPSGNTPAGSPQTPATKPRASPSVDNERSIA